MRADIYAHLQRLPPAFHDEWQSGQLLSRATTDLSAIRRFAGFGTIFLVTNVVTFIAVVALLIRLNWWLGLLTATVFLPVVAASTRFQQTYRVLSRRAQDQQGDLATYVEEAATGIRVLKALGRGDEAAGQHRGQALEVFGTELPEGPAAQHLLGRPGPDPERADRPPAAARRHRHRPARADPGRPGRVHHADPAAGLAHRVDGLHPGRRPGSRHRGPADLRDPGHPARHRQPGRAPGRGHGAAGAAGGTAGPAGLRPRRVQLPRRGAAFTARREPGRRAGPDRGPGRGDGVGQDDPAATGPPARRRDVGGGPAGRHGCAAAAAAGAAVPGRLRVRGPDAVLRQCPGERQLRRARR